MARTNGKNGNSGDDELARQALREVLQSPKAGTRVRTSAARNLLRANGAFVDKKAAGGEAEDPMRDLQLCEDARQALQLKGRRKAWSRWRRAYEQGSDLDELEALLRELAA